jgi:hypothetical protein
VVKQRDEKHRVIGICKRSRYGDVPLEKISTVYIERQNLPEVDPVFLDTGLGDNQWTRRTGRWQKSRMVTR